MARDVVIVGCKLPHGLVLHHPMKPSEKVSLNGMNKAIIIGATHVTTEVDAEFWQTWKSVHEGKFPPLDSGAIFEARSTVEAASKAKERANEKTGFERLEPDSIGIKTAEKE